MATKSRSSGRRTADAGSRTTTDHDEIQAWAEAREGKPSCVMGTGGGGDAGVLRIDFPGYSGKNSLHEIEWEEFFEKFDEQGLALVYQERTADGQLSRFNKLVSRENAASGAAARRGNGKGRSQGKSGGSRRKSSASRTKSGGSRGSAPAAQRARGSSSGGGSKSRSGNAAGKKKSGSATRGGGKNGKTSRGGGVRDSSATPGRGRR